jgi:cyanophycinase
MSDPGPLVLVGGGEWREGADFDARLLEEAGWPEVMVLPTAAAYERPDKAVAWATSWFESLGAKVSPLMVLSHDDACSKENAKVLSEARFIYLGGGSPLHLRAVLTGTPLCEALRQAWFAGAVLAASSAGAMVLCDPMVDPRGGGLGVGLGLVAPLAVVPHHDRTRSRLFWRTLELAPPDVPVAGIPERTALVRLPEGTWQAEGAKAAEVEVYLAGQAAGLEVLAASRPR